MSTPSSFDDATVTNSSEMNASVVQRDVQVAVESAYEDEKKSVQVQRQLALELIDAMQIRNEVLEKKMDAQFGWVPRPSSGSKTTPLFSKEGVIGRSSVREHEVVMRSIDASAPPAPTPSSLNRKPRATKQLILRENDMSGNAFAQKSYVGYGWSNVWEEAWARGQWLLTLLLVQSSSSVVLQEYSDLVRDNIVITLFLTMLVGSGGHAGNQSAIRVIRGLATGEMEVTRGCIAKTMWQQTRVGLLLATLLSTGGFLRVLLTEIDGVGGEENSFVAGETSSVLLTTDGDMVMTQGLDALPSTDTLASTDITALVGATGIALSLFFIVTISTMVGTAMPFALAATGQDPANAGTSIQICLDIVGVLVTCVVCTAVFAHVVPVVQPVVMDVMAVAAR